MFATTENFLFPNGTFIVELILFIIILGTVAKFILPPIQKTMSERAEHIRSALSASDEGQAEADRLVNERRGVLEDARTQARSALEETNQKINTMLEEARSRGQQEHDRLITEAQARLVAERDRTHDEVIARLGDLVIAAASNIVGQPVDPAQHRSVIDETIHARLAEARARQMLIASANFGESYILEIVALVLVALVVRRYIVPVLRRMMNARLDVIRSQLSAGDEAKAAAARLVEVRRGELDEARSQAAAIVDQAHRSSEQLLADARLRCDEEYERLVTHASTQIELELQAIRSEVMATMSSYVLSGTHRVVEIELNATRHRDLIDEAIAAVETELTT